MVHSYGRNHSLIELEDGNSITEGRESCWTLRHDPQVTNSAVFHNGHMPVAEQTAKLIVTDHLGVDHETSFEIPAMRPFETVMFEVERIFPDVKSCLDGKDGWASVHFDNHSSFTRLLILWRHEQSRELQVTHSNFDYSEHQTDMVKTDMPAYMKVPEIPGVEDTNVVVYPKFSPGTYELCKVTTRKDRVSLKDFKSHQLLTRWPSGIRTVSCPAVSSRLYMESRKAASYPLNVRWVWCMKNVPRSGSIGLSCHKDTKHPAPDVIPRNLSTKRDRSR